MGKVMEKVVKTVNTMGCGLIIRGFESRPSPQILDHFVHLGKMVARLHLNSLTFNAHNFAQARVLDCPNRGALTPHQLALNR